MSKCMLSFVVNFDRLVNPLLIHNVELVVISRNHGGKVYSSQCHCTKAAGAAAQNVHTQYVAVPREACPVQVYCYLRESEIRYSRSRIDNVDRKHDQGMADDNIKMNDSGEEEEDDDDDLYDDEEGYETRADHLKNNQKELEKLRQLHYNQIQDIGLSFTLFSIESCQGKLLEIPRTVRGLGKDRGSMMMFLGSVCSGAQEHEAFWSYTLPVFGQKGKSCSELPSFYQSVWSLLKPEPIDDDSIERLLREDEEEQTGLTIDDGDNDLVVETRQLNSLQLGSNATSRSRSKLKSKLKGKGTSAKHESGHFGPSKKEESCMSEGNTKNVAVTTGVSFGSVECPTCTTCVEDPGHRCVDPRTEPARTGGNLEEETGRAIFRVKAKIQESHRRQIQSTLTLEDLRPFFTLPRDEAAHEMGICITLLKKICRHHGLERWPYRSLKNVDAKLCRVGQRIASVAEGDESSRESLEKELQALKLVRSRIISLEEQRIS